MISLRDIELRRGSRVLLSGASVSLNPGERVGLVGRNGAGKSSLFGLFNGSLHEERGSYEVPAHWQVAEVVQHMPETDDSATDFVLQGDARLATAMAHLAELEAQHPQDEQAQHDHGLALAQAHLDVGDAGAHDAVARAQTLILGLGFAPDAVMRPVNSFSGGWRMRLQLARALMSPSDLLLLDEPTNHLDLDALVWLETWLRRYAGTLIVISHDREFLDAVTDVTLHIEQQGLNRYGGNYSRFELMRAERMEQQQSAFARQQATVAHLQKFIDRFKAKASKARQAQSRVKALERMQRIAPVLADADFTFDFLPPASLPNPMLTLRDAELGYVRTDEDGTETGRTTILQSVSRSLLAGQRIGVLGANGQGKSTFIKTIAGVLQPLSGRITEGKGLKVGYFAQQELDVLRIDESPLQHMIRLARDSGEGSTPRGREQALRSYLGSFNFVGEAVNQSVGSMSGGEKARLVLAMLVWQRPNLLLLDEPTNHLDLATREALAMALNSFDGSMLLVSHDRALLRAVCDDFWLVAHGALEPFEGDLEDYQALVLEQARARREQFSAKAGADKVDATKNVAAPALPKAAAAVSDPKPSAPPDMPPAERRRRDAQARGAVAQRLKPIKTQISQIDAELAALRRQHEALGTQLADTSGAQVDHASIGRQMKAAEDRIDALEGQWLELAEQAELIEKEATTG